MPRIIGGGQDRGEGVAGGHRLLAHRLVPASRCDMAGRLVPSHCDRAQQLDLASGPQPARTTAGQRRSPEQISPWLEMPLSAANDDRMLMTPGSIHLVYHE
jgi:hypothetical protein